jgi:hypothetical protein
MRLRRRLRFKHKVRRRRGGSYPLSHLYGVALRCRRRSGAARKDEFGGPIPGQQVGEFRLGRVADAGKTSASQASGSTPLRRAGGLDERVHNRGAAARRRPSRRRDSSCARGQSRGHSANVGQEVEVCYRWQPSMGGAFGASTASGAPVRSFTSRWRPAWLSWCRHRCSTRPPAPEWRSAHCACLYRRWLNCITC